MRKNEYKISYEIVNALSKTGSHNKRRLKGIIQSQQYLGYPVSEKLYRYNVNKLINSNVIKELNKEDWIRGKSMLLDLTESTKEALKLKTFRLKSNRKTIDKHIEQTIEDKREKAYQILFYSSIIIPIVPDHPISLLEFPNFYTPGLPFAHLFSSSQPDKEFVKECISLLEKEKKLIRITDQAERQIFHIPLFFSPILVFYLPNDPVIGFILSTISAILMGIVVSMNVYIVKHSGNLKVTMGSLFSGSTLSMISSTCASCSSVGFLLRIILAIIIATNRRIIKDPSMLGLLEQVVDIILLVKIGRR